MTTNETEGGLRPAIDNSTSASSFGYSTEGAKRQAKEWDTDVVSLSLLRGLSAKRNDPTLFDSLDEVRKMNLQASDERYLVDRRGKPIILTPTQNLIVFHLGHRLGEEKKNNPEGLREWVATIGDQNEFKKSGTDGFGYALTIDLKEFTKEITADGQARSRQKERVMEELTKLAGINQLQSLWSKTASGTIQIPLLYIGPRLEARTLDGEKESDLIRIYLSPIFFHELFTRYSVLRPSLLNIMGKSGADTSLFYMLTSELLAKAPLKRADAMKAAREIKRGSKSAGKYLEEVKEAQEAALVYKENISTLLGRIPTEYEKTRKQRADLKKNLEAARVRLIESRLISDMTIPEKNLLDGTLVVKFNLDYYKGELEEDTDMELEPSVE